MELIQVSKAIQEKILELSRGRNELKNRAKKKAENIANYERCLAIMMLKLKNGEEIEFDGEKIKNPQTTIIEKLARGICWREKLAMEQAEAEYKNAIVGMKAIEAELNGFQSINRYLDKV